MKFLKHIYIISIIILFTCCKSKVVNHPIKKGNKSQFSIAIDTLECQKLKANVTTQYIYYVNKKNREIEDKINKKIAYLFKDVYPISSKKSIVQINKECCNDKEFCDFNIQEYKINFENTELASLSYRTYLFSYNPSNFKYANFNLKSGETLNIQNLFSKEGISFLINDLNNKIDTAIAKESSELDEEDLLLIKDIFENKTSISIENLNNFKLFKEGGQMFVKFLYSFNATDYQNQLLPMIDLKYNLNDLQNYTTKEFRNKIKL